jgi:tetratricopeptide (TPR) repeat protein
LIRSKHYNSVRDQKREDEFSELSRSIEDMVCQSDQAKALEIRIESARKKNEAMKEYELISLLRILLKYVLRVTDSRNLKRNDDLLKFMRRQDTLLNTKLQFDPQKKLHESELIKRFSADAFYAKGEFEKASSIYTALTKTPIPDPEIMKLAAICFYELKQMQQALKSFSELKRVGAMREDVDVERIALEYLIKIYKRAGQARKVQDCETRLDEICGDEEDGEDLASVFLWFLILEYLFWR